MHGHLEDYLYKVEAKMQEAVKTQLTAYFEQYDKVAKSFQQFFSVEELGSLLDRKADLELIRRINAQMATKIDMQGVAATISEINQKLKHMSVFQSELSQMLLPEHQSKGFKNGEDLNNTIKRREKLIKEGLIMCNWIQKTSKNIIVEAEFPSLNTHESVQSPSILPADPL